MIDSTVTPLLVHIIPVFVTRLANIEIVEPSEEIRLCLVQTLCDIVKAVKAEFNPFVADAVKILVQALSDTFPEVKRETCSLILLLTAHNKEALSYHGSAIVKALSAILNHRHANVRIIALQAITEAMVIDASGIDDALPVLNSLVFDKSPKVREALYQLANQWLTRLLDRYTYGHKVLPLLLAGLSDPIDQLSSGCDSLMNCVGELYESEWESRIKDEMDFSDGWDYLPSIHLLQRSSQSRL
jgi:dynein assembly factor 5